MHRQSENIGFGTDLLNSVWERTQDRVLVHSPGVEYTEKQEKREKFEEA
jgi:hypothetical protein